MGVRYQSLMNIVSFTTEANTDITTDITIAHDGILKFAIETTTAADVRMTLNTTNFTTLIDTAADIWTFVEVPCTAGDVLNIQTVDIEAISITCVLVHSTERD